MKVVLFVSSYNARPGGHYYTVLAHYKALSKTTDCTIVNVGRVPSPVYASLGENCKFVSLRSFSALRSFRELLREYQASPPDVLHSFDVLAHWVAHWLSGKLGVGHVHTKCGGPSPVGYYPECHDIILFSKENLEWFSQSPNHQSSRLTLLPNRVVREPVNQERIDWFRSTYVKPEKIHLLMIARFVSLKRRQFVTAKTLMEKLRDCGIACQTTFIGVVQEDDFFEEVKAWNLEGAQLLTTADVTVNASDFLSCADIVVATGRSVMEASSLGLITVLPSSDEEAILFSEETFEEAASYNFSVRGIFSDWTTERTVLKVRELLENDNRALAFRESIKNIYRRHFDLESKIEELKEVYRGSRPSECRISLDSLRQRFYLIRKLMFGI